MKTEKQDLKVYIDQLPEERKPVFEKLYDTIKDSLPKGFSEEFSYGMPSFVISLKDYPEGYHCAKDTALPFLSLANQKNFIALYHMGMYAKPEILEWFQNEFPKHSKKKLDMGKSCVRFKKSEDIPFELIGELAKKMTPNEWIEVYEKNFKRK